MGFHHHAGSARRRLAGLITGVLLPLAVAAPASAASLAVNKPCYVFTKHHAATMVVTGTGFVPDDTVRLTSSLGWSASKMAKAGPTGSFTATLQAPKPTLELPGQTTVTLTADDFESSQAISATAPVTLARFGVAVVPNGVPVSQKLTWYLAGFRPGKEVFVHYLHSTPVAVLRLARASGPCGVVKARARLYPGGHPRYRRYSVQIDDSRHYAKHNTPHIDTVLNFKLS